jgi:hypothetical protein
LSTVHPTRFSGELLLALARMNLAETMIEAVETFLTFEARTLHEHAALSECYRLSIERIDAKYSAQVAIRKAQG